ncbi:23S rRNA (pseudouridine(1915)-N(3))-methyltransferase RlmH [Chitinispirillales bacterium ANBcel5]|uniref:23S rRNA (pseudouridine(1915)-N(3))-methyltransferase RlmH n=1 Tax=Cellulosispirillum alkaliphilum TaxID=3039283 RepID=UPI002A56E8C1|nr:23S rRNA (pseudouridine(1915)-N(3))-methyltransferase RlmH [Chitinispirillales bacterium ANBcel5]
MFIKVVAVGKVKERYLLTKIQEYQKLIGFDARLEVVEIRDGNRATEGEKILSILKKSQGYSFALAEEGKQFSSREFAQNIQNYNSRMVFVIGGPDGLSEKVKEYADLRFSLSRMTFTHDLARLILFEQMYRALSIIRGRKYHRD